MILIQIGQCGIQCGQEIVKAIQNKNSFTNPIKQLLIDTEHKVIKQYKTSNDQTKQEHDINSVNLVSNDNSNCLSLGKNGAGNNWAMGYYKGTEEIDKILNQLNKMLEPIDVYKGFNFVHSIAGGTGSGLLSKMIEEIKDIYPKSCLSTYSYVYNCISLKKKYLILY